MRLGRIGFALIIAGLVAFWLPESWLGAAVGAPTTSTTDVAYACRGAGFAAGITVPAQTITVSMTAPADATPGSPFDVTISMPYVKLTAPPLDLNAFNVIAKLYLEVTGGTAPSGQIAYSGKVTFTDGTNGFTGTFAPVKLPVIAGSTVGAPTVVTLGTMDIVTGTTGFVCDPSTATKASVSVPTVAAGGATTTTAAGATTTTGPTTTTTSTSTTTTTSTSTSTTTTTTGPATTTTTGPTTTTTPPAQNAQIVSKNATISYTCNVFNPSGTKLNTADIPPSNVTATITVPDRVGVGSTFSVGLLLNPGPKNGPINLTGGATFKAKVRMSGAGSPAEVEMSGTTSTPFPPEAATVSPQMAGAVTATGAAGSRIEFSLGAVDVIATLGGQSYTTKCNPTSTSPSINSSEIVAGQVNVPTTTAAPAQVSPSTTLRGRTVSNARPVVRSATASRGGNLARTGAGSDVLTWVATASMIVGAGLLLASRRRLAD